MRIPVMRSLQEYSEEKGTAPLEETVEVLEHLSQTRGLKDEELEVMGELISNLLGSIEVSKEIQAGTPQKEALNQFMKRVLGSIDR